MNNIIDKRMKEVGASVHGVVCVGCRFMVKTTQFKYFRGTRPLIETLALSPGSGPKSKRRQWEVTWSTDESTDHVMSLHHDATD